MEKLSVGARLRVEITDTLPDGRGVCRVDGFAVFVSEAVAPDELEIRIERLRKSYGEARILSVIKPSPHRIKPACPVFGRCGGCDLCHTDFETELAVKRNGVHNLLRKAGLPTVPVENTLTDFSRAAYRNKAVVYPVGGGWGFMEKQSDRIVPVSSCALLSPLLEALCTQTAKALCQNGESHAVRAIYVRVSEAMGQGMVCLVLKNGYGKRDIGKASEALRQAPKLRTLLINTGSTGEGSPVGGKYETLWGDGYIEDILGGVRFRISAAAFYQVNRPCTELLYDTVDAYAAIEAGDTVADLYCGVGTIGMYLAYRHPDARFFGVEIVPEAIEDAKENAEANGITNVTFACGDAGSFREAVDVAIVDPPRKGLSREMIDSLLALSPRRIVYVSCDPATMARDVARLTANGYAATEVTPVNMFPQTKHVESVVCLTRRTRQ